MTIGLVDGIITNSKSIKEVYEGFPWMEPDKTVVIIMVLVPRIQH